MNKADAILLLKEAQEQVQKEPANVHVLFIEALEDALLSTEAPASETLTVIWSDGYLRGLAAAMHANRIPPVETKEAYKKIVDASHVLMTDFLSRIQNGAGHDQN